MLLGNAAIGGGLAGMAVLHLMSGLDPLQGMISAYVFAPYGWLLPVSLTLIAVGSAVLAVRLAGLHPTPLGRGAALLIGLWSCCLLLVAGFPTDRPGVSLSLSGGIHRYAAFVAFLSVPIAGLIVAGMTGSRLRASVLRWLSMAALGSLVLVAVPYVIRALGIDPGAVPAGLTQRLTVVTEVAALIVMPLRRPAPRPSPGRDLVTARERRPGGSDQAERTDRVALLHQFVHRGVDPLPGERVDLQPLDDLPPAVHGDHRERGDETLGNAVRAVRRNGGGGPVALGRAGDPVVDVVDGRVRR